ncbi:DUF3667 domain-containing protein [Chryseobacterium sp.]|uniref:DUF3667 domain-containing protein n=1 Tax=Chryseobacterium sp. TaxID=1871047 RepID=UPI0011C82AFF|nr:DUF3667 domain-containing protein [Chryseobacterium sp.]TXF79499.1 DUF3667 domain-containing protein [Chryseobacterium sp.]
MTDKNCLNCGKELTDKYCSGCGQKAATHRITFKHFISHDVLHGTLHLEKGMFFTAKQALIRPGQAALDYISGKRVNYYNVFYFILLLIGFNILLTHYYNEIALKVDPSRALIPTTNEAGKTIGEILFKYGKLFIFALVPATALNSFMIFKRKSLNYTEHFMISGLLLLGIFLITTLVIVFSFLEFAGLSPDFFDFIHRYIPHLVMIYIIFGYYNAFREDYSLPGFGYRMLLFILICSAEIILFLCIIAGIATGWKSDEIDIQFVF